MEAEFESVRDWCDVHDFEMTSADKAEIERRGLTDTVEDLKAERDESKNEIDQSKNADEENKKDRGENKKETDDKPLTADEVTNIKCILPEYSPHLLNCEIRGVPDVLTYKVTQHDYGDGFTLHSQKDDIWNTMERKEMRQLEDTVSAEVTFHELSESIDKAETMRELRDIRFDIVEGDDLNLSDEHTAKLYDKLNERENELIEASLIPTKDEKRSVLDKLNEKKDEAKTPEMPRSKTHTEKESR